MVDRDIYYVNMYIHTSVGQKRTRRTITHIQKRTNSFFQSQRDDVSPFWLKISSIAC